MIKEKYLSDLIKVDMNKPKAKKIMKKFYEKIDSIDKKMKRIEKNGFSNIEVQKIQRCNLLNTLYEMRPPFFHKSNSTVSIEIYKNDFDDFFLYISSLSNEKNSKPSFGEYIFLLNDKNDINYDNNCVSLINFEQYPYSPNNPLVNNKNFYRISFSNIEHTVIEEYNQNKNDKKLYNYADIISTENTFYSAKHTKKKNNAGNHVFYSDSLGETEFYIDRVTHSNELVSDLMFKHKSNVFEINIDLESITVELSVEKDYTIEPIFSFTKRNNIYDNYDEFQKNDYEKEEYNNIAEVLDLIQLTHDVVLSKEDQKYFTNMCLQIPNIYELMKNINNEDAFLPEKILKDFLYISKDKNTLSYNKK